jgi:hypothetical protein
MAVKLVRNYSDRGALSSTWSCGRSREPLLATRAHVLELVDLMEALACDYRKRTDYLEKSRSLWFR